MIRFSKLSLVDYIDTTIGLRDSNMRNWPLAISSLEIFEE